MSRHLTADDVADCAICERQWIVADFPDVERYGLCPSCVVDALKVCMVCEELVDPSSAAGRVARPLCDGCTFDGHLVVHLGGDVWRCVDPFPVGITAYASVMERARLVVYPTVDMLLAHDIAVAASA